MKFRVKGEGKRWDFRPFRRRDRFWLVMFSGRKKEDYFLVIFLGVDVLNFVVL